MKAILSETITYFHEVDISDELDIDQIIEMANKLKKRCDTGLEAINLVLEAYKGKFGFDYHITPNACGTEFEELNYEYTIEE